VLTSDTYRSFPLGEVFAKIFPDEYFHSYTSPQRVHKLVYLLRKEFKRYRVPVEILVSDGHYKLMIEKDYSFRLYNLNLLSKTDLKLSNFYEMLKKKWPYQSFRNVNVAKTLNLPKEKVMRWTAKLEKEKKLRANGYGKGKEYVVA
jgi:hypothetical protein